MLPDLRQVEAARLGRVVLAEILDGEPLHRPIRVQAGHDLVDTVDERSDVQAGLPVDVTGLVRVVRRSGEPAQLRAALDRAVAYGLGAEERGQLALRRRGKTRDLGVVGDDVRLADQALLDSRTG